MIDIQDPFNASTGSSEKRRTALDYILDGYTFQIGDTKYMRTQSGKIVSVIPTIQMGRITRSQMAESELSANDLLVAFVKGTVQIPDIPHTPPKNAGVISDIIRGNRFAIQSVTYQFENNQRDVALLESSPIVEHGQLTHHHKKSQLSASALLMALATKSVKIENVIPRVKPPGPEIG